MKSLSQFVKERRKAVNLTQEEFADRAGVALTVVTTLAFVLRLLLPFKFDKSNDGTSESSVY